MQVQKKKTKSDFEFNTPTESNLNKKEVEQKLLDRFDFLKNENNFQQFFSSYDFRFEEKNMVEMWEQILQYLLTDIFFSFGTTISDLKKYTLLKNTIPLGLNNIIQQLRIEQKYITDEDLKNETFYQINFPELYPQEKGYFSSFLGGLKSIMNIAGGKMGCNEDNDNNEQEMKIRTDITEEEKYKILPDNSIIFNYERFKIHCNQLLSVLIDILREDDEEVIQLDKFKKKIIEEYTKKDGKIGNLISLPYGIQYIDYSLYYLMKIKKIILFEIELNNKNVKCIKLLKNPEDTINQKDEAISKLLVQIEVLEKRTKEYQKKIENTLEEAKIKLKKGDKQGARISMIKKKNYLKFLENTQNTQNVLEQQIFDLKNAESNANVTDVLKQCLEAGKEINVNPDEFADVASDLKDAKESLNEINAGISEFVDEKEENELNEEMEKLELESKNEKDDLPNAVKENIDENKIFENLAQ